jgi:hypothetical protein
MCRVKKVAAIRVAWASEQKILIEASQLEIKGVCAGRAIGFAA